MWSTHEALGSALVSDDDWVQPVLQTGRDGVEIEVLLPGGEGQSDQQLRDRLQTSRLDALPAPGICIEPMTDGGAEVLLLAPIEMVDPESWHALAHDLGLRLDGTVPAAVTPFADVAGWLAETLAPLGQAERDDTRRAVHPLARTPGMMLPGDWTDQALLRAWTVVLARFFARDTIVVDVSVSCRPALGLDAAIGPYRVPRRIVAPIPQDARLSDIVMPPDAVHPLANLADLQLYPVAADAGFCLIDVPKAESQSVACVGILWTPGRAPISLVCTRTDGATQLFAAFDPSHIPPFVAQNMVVAMQAVLAVGAAAPDSLLQSVDLSSSTSCPSISCGPTAAIETLSFAAQVDRVAMGAADRIALEAPDGTMTYAELVVRGGQVAAGLAALGLGPGDRIGLALDRSVTFVATVLAVSRLGAVFVPLDPHAPAARLDAMIAKGGLVAVLCDGTLALSAPGVPVYPVASLATAEGSIACHPVQPDDLAYVLHTSGSTGVPKPVELTHRGLNNYLGFALKSYGLGAGDGVIANTPVTFDLTLTTILAPLLAGQRILLVPQADGAADAAANVTQVAALLRSHAITALKTTPSYLRLLNAALAGDMAAARVGTLILGGEALRDTDLRPWIQHGAAGRIVNEYGPTETVVGATVADLGALTDLTTGTPIGTPIDNVMITIRDGTGRVVPAGVAGEVWISGPGVARGYTRMADASAKVFVTDPETGVRFYRTGDLARMSDPQTTHFLGRIDTQLKINGLRIEPREIELALEALSGIEAAVAVKASDGDGDRLVAFVVTTGPLDRPTQALRDQLGQTLPAAFVPQVIRVLPSWPLNANQKIDLARLSAMAAEVLAFDGGCVEAPRNKTEAALAGIFAAVLKREIVQPDEDFFGLGGDSIRSIAVVGRAAKLGLPITVADLFEARTPRALADRLATKNPAALPPARAAFAGLPDSVLARMPDGIVDAYGVSQLQTAMIFHNALDTTAATYHDVFTYRFKGRFDEGHMRRAAARLVARHEVLRTTFHLGQFPEPLQLVHQTGADLFSAEDLTDRSPEDQAALIDDAFVQACKHPFDVGTLPLMRLRAQVLDAEHFQLTMSFHHCIIDGWSDVSLLMELFDICHALARGSDTVDRPPSVRYSDFVALEKATIQSDAARNYWRETLRGAVPGLVGQKTGADRPEALATTGVQIPRAVSDGLLRVARDAGLPVKSVLFAAHARVIGELLGQTDLVTSMVVNGRPEVDQGDAAVGLFINSVPLRMDLAGGTWRDTIHGAIAAEAALMPYRRMPLSEIMDITGQPHLSDTLFYFTDYHQASRLESLGFEMLDLRGHEASSFTLAANFSVHPFEKKINLTLAYRPGALADAVKSRLAALYLDTLNRIAADVDAAHDLAPAAAISRPSGVLTRIAASARRHPDRPALIDGTRRIDHATLARMTAVAATRLRALIKPGDRVAIAESRTAEFVASVISVMQAGGVYLPLDRANPAGRTAAILRDAAPALVIGQPGTVLDPLRCITPEALFAGASDAPGPDAATPHHPGHPAPEPLPGADDPAYLIYTSGSTGTPKGVLVGHEALDAVFLAMQSVTAEGTGSDASVWLWLTGAGFDISVLEMLFPLTVGGSVVVHDGNAALFAPHSSRTDAPARISLSFFNSQPDSDPYALLMSAARCADDVGLHAVWTPERHFHAFGGPFPNPAITSAALSSVTRRIAIRAGSLVLPLHDPVRVAEDWAVIDQLSRGRAGIAFASGWHPQDFALAPDGLLGFDDRHQTMLDGINTIRSLWRGETVTLTRGGAETRIAITPRPVNGPLPLWLSAAGSRRTFEAAARLDAGILTHLLGQSTEQLRSNIGHYHAAAGGEGRISLMLHCCVAETTLAARRRATDPLTRYLYASADLAKSMFGAPLDHQSHDDLSTIVSARLDHYIDSASLICSERDALERIAGLRAIGVSEFACLVDFGVAPDHVLAGIERLGAIQDRLNRNVPKRKDLSFAAICCKHGVSHVQTTPTVLRELLADRAARAALRDLRLLLVGGERLPEHVAADLAGLRTLPSLNMYGPTETTIWTSATLINGKEVSIGGALGDFHLLICDDDGRAADTGEIVIAGRNLALGYWNNPSETAHRFVTLDESFGLGPLRAYRTGDRARREASGRLVYLGRTDSQIKLGGYRAEPGEIEAILRAQPGIVDAACLMDADNRLTAYVKADADHAVDLSQLARALGDRLPAALCPTLISVVDRFPRTPNGKLNGATARGSDPQTVAPPPGSTLRLDAAAIWAETLTGPPLTDAANFFEMGGNSLRAMVLASRLRERLGLNVTVGQIFDFPCFGALLGVLEQARASVDTAPMPPAAATRVTAGFAQTRLWLLSRIAPDSAAYNDATLLRLTGPVRTDDIQHALRRLIARHDALRMQFVEVAGRVEAECRAEVAFSLKVEDLRALPACEHERHIQDAARRDSTAVFDLSSAPLLRATAWVTADDSLDLLICVHHIVCDGWSLSVLLEAFSKLLLEAQTTDEADQPAAFSLLHHFATERAALTPARRDALLRYWTQTLADPPPPLELPLDRRRPGVQGFTGAKRTRRISPEVSLQMASFARSAATTPFVVLFSAVSSVLGRFCGQNDIRLGSDVALRQSGVPDDAVGMFVNQIVLRCLLDPTERFDALVARNRQTLLQALEHSDLPFHMLVESLSPARDLARNPLYQISVNYQETAERLDRPDALGRQISRLALNIGISRVDLEINATAGPGGLSVEAIYDDTLYNAQSIDRLLAALECFLATALTKPDGLVAQMPVIAGAERDLLLAGLGASAEASPGYGPSEALRRFAAQTPDAPAIVSGAECLSYGALEAHVDAVARGLSLRGVAKGSVVATCLDRSPDLLTVILALWRLGAVYVPLDPAQSTLRLSGLVQDVAAQMVVGRSDAAPMLEQLAGKAAVVCLEDLPLDGPQVVQEPDLADRPAYILYTSGSTGKPKGAIVLHKGMRNHLEAKVRDLGLVASDRLAQNAPLTFDIVIWQFFAPLMVGGSVHVFDADTIRDPALLIDACDAVGITLLELVPSFLSAVLEEARQRGGPVLGDLRVLISTGEALPVALCRRWFDHFPDVTFINAYGPTECSDDVAHHVMRQAPPANANCVPIGRPIRNVRLFVLGEAQQLCPVGAVGELYVSGVAVGGGYVNNPGATAANFLPDRFSDIPGAQMYRTGDLVRWTDEGALEYLGRIDSQVKIRGCRIELGEIEATLAAHPLVRTSVVKVLDAVDDRHNARLAAYVVPEWTEIERTLGNQARQDRESEWQSVYDYYYEDGAQGEADADPTFDITGWTDSFTGTPIPSDAMQDWLSQAVARMGAFQPRRILEIGCGTGMVAFQLAGNADRYLGLDFSRPVVETLRHKISSLRPDWSHVEVRQGAAHELDRVDEGGFDLIVLNSVVQYFPSVRYLMTVLESAARKLAPGGSIYLGDLRTLELQKIFHQAVAAARTPDNLVRHAVSSLERDKELAVSPALFARMAGLGWCQRRGMELATWLKSGPHDTELTRYRFDAALMFDSADARLPPPVTRTWEEVQSAQALADLLRRAAKAGTGLHVTEMPNPRLAQDAARDRTRQKIGKGVAIDDLLALARAEGFLLQSRPARDPFKFDLMFQPRLAGWPADDLPGPVASEPLLPKIRQSTVETLLAWMRDRLPDYMMPHSLTVLSELPLTMHGKTDIKALPVPERLAAGDDPVADRPLTQTEATLRRIWEEVLAISPIGLRENFFDLGGDSILAIQVVGKAAKMGLRLTPKLVFRHLTIAELASATGSVTAAAPNPAAEGNCPLSPAQAQLLERNLSQPGHWNQAIRLSGALLTNPTAVQDALDAVLDGQDVLRLRYAQAVSGEGAAPAFHQAFAKTTRRFDFTLLRPGTTIESCAAHLNAPFDLAEGPLLRAALRPGPDPELLLVAHHLIVDLLSWQILIEDLGTTLSARAALPPQRPRAGFRDWIEALIGRAESLKSREHLGYWVAQHNLGARHPIAGRPNAQAPGIVRHDQRLSREMSDALLHLGAAPVIEAALATALMLALHDVTGRRDVVLQAESHGRDAAPELDLSQTMGWFAVEYPVRLRLPHNSDDRAAVHAIEQSLRLARSRAASYGILRHFDPDDEVRRSLQSLPAPEIGFNYFGTEVTETAGAGQLFRTLGDVGPLNSGQDRAETALELNALFRDGLLHLFWNREQALLSSDLVNALARAFPAMLDRVLRARPSAPGAQRDLLPSDIEGDELAAAMGEVGI